MFSSLISKVGFKWIYNEKGDSGGGGGGGGKKMLNETLAIDKLFDYNHKRRAKI